MGEEGEDDGVFVPLRLFYGVRPGDRREQERDRWMADRVDRRREHGGRPAPRARGLSRGDIVAVAVTIADAEGTDAVSIRRIARDLRVGPMSLYWHVSSTEELHQLMLEKVQHEVEAHEPSGDWRTDLRSFAASTRAALLRHPWAIDFLGAGPPSGPNDARNLERLMGAFDGLEIDLTSIVWSLMALVTYVMGAALREIQEMRWQSAAEATTAEMSEGEISAARDEFDRRLRRSGRYPHLTRMLDANIDPDSPESRDERFEFGLSCVLDGIAARVRALPAGARRPGKPGRSGGPTGAEPSLCTVSPVIGGPTVHGERRRLPRHPAGEDKCPFCRHVGRVFGPCACRDRGAPAEWPAPRPLRGVCVEEFPVGEDFPHYYREDHSPQEILP